MAAMKSGMIPRSLQILLLLVVGMIIFALDAAEAFTVANNLKTPLTLLEPPGCCSPCGPYDPPPGVICPEVCVQCPDVVVGVGKAVTLDKHVGPYPLPALQIQVGEVVSCVRGGDLERITASATVTVGPGQCGPSKTDLQASFFLAEKPSQVVPICLQDCSL